MPTEAPPPGSPRHAAWLYTPAEARDGLAALLAVETQIAASADPALAHEVAHVRLAWWQDEAAALTLGKPRHPLTQRLLAETQRQQLAAPDLRPWVAAVRQRLAKVAWLNRDELHAHHMLWVEAIWFNAAGCDNGAARASAALRDTGLALRELELLTSLADDARSGWLCLPLDEMKQIGVDTADCYAQPWNDALCTLIRARLRACLSRLDAPIPGGRGAAAWIAVAQRSARRMEQALPMQYHAELLSFLAAGGDAVAAWRAARRAQHAATTPAAAC